jgi:hypothetical protein
LIINGTTTYYLIDSNNPTGYAKPIEQWTSTTGNRSTATLSMSYVIGDRVLAQVNGSGAVSYLLIDGQYNTRALTNSSGVVTATFNYSDFGDVLGATYTAANPPPTMYLFQQTMFDAPSGLNIFGDGVREVQPGEDSFIESDTSAYGDLSNPITLNLRLLDGANPISNIDQNGHDFSLTEVLGTLGIDEDLEGEEDGAATQAVRRAITSKQFDVYVGLSRGGLSPGSSVFIPHAFLYVASKEFDAGQVFDVGRSGLSVHSENLEYEKSESIFLYRFAQFTPIQYATWTTSAYVIASIPQNDEGLPSSENTLWSEIELAFSFTFAEGTVNCYKFTLLAGLDALATARLPI